VLDPHTQANINKAESIRDVAYVIVPREIFGDGKAEVFGVVDDLKLLAVDIIICHDLITLVRDA
jgi:hypothetical protein